MLRNCLLLSIRRLLVMPLCVLMLLSAALAQEAVPVPHLVKFSGVIPGMQTGTAGVVFALYKDQAGGAPLWQEVQSVEVDASGHYAAVLGARSTKGISLEVFSSGEARWLGVQAQGQAEQPRLLLVSVPYAMKASDAETLGGLPASAFLRADAVAQAASYINTAAVASAASQLASTPAIVASGASAGYLPVFTDAAGDLGNSLLYQSGGNIGFGTTSPAFPMHFISQGPSAAVVAVDGYGASTGVAFVGRHARGTLAAPTALLANDNIFTIQGRGYYSSADGTNQGFTPSSRAFMKIFAAEDWTDIGQGAYISFATTAIGTNPGSSSATEKMRITDKGYLGIGTTTVTYPLTVNGAVQSMIGGYVFPDKTVQTTAAVSGALPTSPDGSLTVGGTAVAPTLIVANGGITDAKISASGVSVGKVTGAASLLASNTFTLPQYINVGTTGAVGLRVEADNTGLSPSAILAVTGSGDYLANAIHAVSNGAANQATAITADSTGVAIRANSSTASALYATSSYTGSATVVGAQGTIAGSAGYGVYGEADSTTGATFGVEGYSYSTGGIGTAGVAAASTGTTYGVQGTSYSNSGTGVQGVANGYTGGTTGIAGDVASDSGTGARGFASSFTGNTYGVAGITRSPGGTALLAMATAETCTTVRGIPLCSVIPGGTAGSFQVGTGGTLLLGQTTNTGFITSNVFRVDSTGKGFFDGGTQTGGADFAESVDVEGEAASYAPGELMMVDTERDRQFKLVAEPYSTLVAGIYATKPGVLATPHGMDDARLGGEIPLAMVGIVPCKVTAENGAIHRGDLLVSSSTPGYAMKGTDRARMLGAIVGKALGTLESGTGLVEVLVTLQ